MRSLCKCVVAILCVGGIAVSGLAERIIFVGDSITGQGQNLKKTGWGALVREALEKTSDQKGGDVILLGGSGQSVGSWCNVVKRSKDKELRLDAKKYDVKEELDKGAGKLVIMLGMNDIIGPYVTDDEKSIDSWVARYEKLLALLKERAKPKSIGLATITMHTEDPASFKNKLMDKLNDRIRKLARENGYMLVPVSEEYKRVFAEGRSYKPDFHITCDYVHPSGYGHMAIAAGMLAGMGKPKAAEYIRNTYYPRIVANITKGQKGLSYFLIPDPANKPGKPQRFTIKANCFNFKDPKNVAIKATVPNGWKVTPAELLKGSGEFTVTGNPDRLVNVVKLSIQAKDKTYTRDVSIAAPWLLCWGITQPVWQYKKPLNLAKTITPIDKALDAGESFMTAPTKKGGTAPQWQLYYPSFNYTGGADPNSVDFAAVTADRCFDAAYGTRRIYSPKAQKARLSLNTRLFAGNVFLTVWFNGKKVFQDEMTRKKSKEAAPEVELKKGWNSLVFKSNHRAWLWQNSVGIESPDGKPLNDLRYSVP